MSNKHNSLNRTLPMVGHTSVVNISNEYYLIIGFEVNQYNNPQAYNKETNTQNLDINTGGDYGHAFFFTVQNGKVETFFSFGPAKEFATLSKTEEKVGIDEYSGRRRGDTKYSITEVARLYKFKINKEQLESIRLHADEFTAKVKSGKEIYTVYMNDSCAETAKDVLDFADIDTPNGQGYIKTPSGAVNYLFSRVEVKGHIIPFSGTKFVTPYSWYTNFKSKYGKPFLYKNTGVKANNPVFLNREWTFKEGSKVPNTIQKYSYHSDLSK